MTFNTTAGSLIRHGYARAVDVTEGLELLHQAHEHGLVQFGENVRESVNFICNCCGCCCEAMIAARRFAAAHPVHTTNFLPGSRGGGLQRLRRCVRACPVEALSAGVGQRSPPAQAEEGARRSRSAAWAAGCACAPAGRAR